VQTATEQRLVVGQSKRSPAQAWELCMSVAPVMLAHWLHLWNWRLQHASWVPDSRPQIDRTQRRRAKRGFTKEALHAPRGLPTHSFPAFAPSFVAVMRVQS
jgi:hypothetical protein